MKKYLRDYSFLLLIAGVIIGLDQWTKALIRANLSFQEIYYPWPALKPLVRLVYWQNTGAAFGMFQDMNTVFAVLATVVSLAILYYFPQVSRQDKVLRWAMALQLGGAVGNLIDRLTLKYVIDFVAIADLPVFNVADLSISLGVVVLVVGMWFKERQHQRESQALASQAEEPHPDTNSTHPHEEFQGE